MTRKRTKLLSHKVPVLRSVSGNEYTPDLVIAIQGSLPRLACFNEKADVDKLVWILSDLLEELKDIQWERRKKK